MVKFKEKLSIHLVLIIKTNQDLNLKMKIKGLNHFLFNGLKYMVMKYKISQGVNIILLYYIKMELFMEVVKMMKVNQEKLITMLNLLEHFKKLIIYLSKFLKLFALLILLMHLMNNKKIIMLGVLDMIMFLVMEKKILYLKQEKLTMKNSFHYFHKLFHLEQILYLLQQERLVILDI